jgi:hypothetical protein
VPDREATSRTPPHALTGSPLTRRSAATLIRSTISNGAKAPVVRPPLVNHDDINMWPATSHWQATVTELAIADVTTAVVLIT